MTNPARKFSGFRNDDYDEDYEDAEYYSTPPTRQTTARVPNPNIRPGPPVYRQMGQGQAPITRQINVPQPLGYESRYKQPTTNVPAVRPTQQTRAPYPTNFAPAKSRPQSSSVLERLPLPSGSMLRLAMWLGGALALALVSFFILSNIFSWWQTWQDDMTYGRPRTMQANAFVGHNEQSGKPSHFIAQNIDGQVNIIQYPGNDTSKTRVIQGPRLFGKNAALAPVKIEFKDVNTDGHVDLIARVDGQVLVYVNENGNFRPIRSEEEVRVKQAVGG